MMAPYRTRPEDPIKIDERVRYRPRWDIWGIFFVSIVLWWIIVKLVMMFGAYL